jgi:hypothetical protein
MAAFMTAIVEVGSMVETGVVLVTSTVAACRAGEGALYCRGMTRPDRVSGALFRRPLWFHQQWLPLVVP